MLMNILIGADLVPTSSNTKEFEEGKVEKIVSDDCLKLIREADYSIFNLETPLVDFQTPILKSGPNLSAPTRCINGLSKLNIKMLCLGNNHIMDHGKEGIKTTINCLDANNIEHVGAGENLDEAKKIKRIQANGLSIAIYSCTEHEFSIASNNEPGANPFSIKHSLSTINKAKLDNDYIIVLYHGGKEYYRFPSPELQKNCRALVDAGANIVLCQHSHCIGCEEKYNNSTIVYGQGNFLFDRGNDEFWSSGLLVGLDIESKTNVIINYYPVIKNGNAVELAAGEKKENIINQFYKRSMQIQDPDFIEEKYNEFATDMLFDYLIAISPKENILFRVINKIMKNQLRKKRFEKLYSNQKMLVILNYIECEAHRELFIRGLKRHLDLL